MHLVLTRDHESWLNIFKTFDSGWVTASIWQKNHQGGYCLAHLLTLYTLVIFNDSWGIVCWFLWVSVWCILLIMSNHTWRVVYVGLRLCFNLWIGKNAIDQSRYECDTKWEITEARCWVTKLRLLMQNLGLRVHVFFNNENQWTFVSIQSGIFPRCNCV